MPASPRQSPSAILAWLRPPAAWITGPLLVILAAFCIHLWPEWSHNPDLSHGFFAPVVFVLLVLTARDAGPARWLAPGWRLTALHLLGLGGALGSAILATLLAASVGWNHSVVLTVLAAALASLLFGALTVFADQRVRLLPCNWPALTACGLWLLAVPIPSGTYARLTLHLQTWVTGGVIDLLHFLGIPAQQQGNIIVLARTVVGVEEACSGVRSLISCLYVGLFLSAWKVRSPARRVLLIALAPLLALVMNFIRSAALTLMANAGIDIAGTWHDATGFAILGLTTLLLAGLALQLAPATDPEPAPVPAGPGPFTAGHGFFLGGTALLTALAGFVVFASRPATGADDPAAIARLESLLPVRFAGWESQAPDNLYQFSATLRTEHLVERTYHKLKDGESLQLNVYAAYWPTGAAPVSLVASHTPDACWPGAGWRPQPAPVPRLVVATPAGPLPPAEHRVFRSQRDVRQEVWFWHLYNGRPINYRDPYSIPALLELALHYGFSREGPQCFIRITSNQPWEKFADEPLLAEILARARPLGLAP